MAGVSHKLRRFATGQAYLVQCYYGGVLTIPALALAVLGSSLSFVAAVLFARAANRRLPALAALFAFPALWTGLEYAVGLVSSHGSFGSLAYRQVSFPLGIQTVSLFGLYAVTFLLCLFANALALILRRSSNAVLAGGTGLLICTLSFGFGAWRLAQPVGMRVKVAALANEGGAAYVKAFKTGDLALALAITTDYAAAVRAMAAGAPRRSSHRKAAFLSRPPGARPHFSRSTQRPRKRVCSSLRASPTVLRRKIWRLLSLPRAKC